METLGFGNVFVPEVQGDCMTLITQPRTESDS